MMPGSAGRYFIRDLAILYRHRVVFSAQTQASKTAITGA
jgi:hypothetical protein